MAVTRKYAQINACTNEVVLIGDATLGMPVADTNLVYTINIFEHSQRDIIDVYWKYNKATGLFEEPDIDPLPLPVVQETVAVNAEKDGSDTIVLTLGESVGTGSIVKFFAPCSCLGIAKIKILDTVYDLVDAVGNTVAEISCGEGGVFVTDALVAAMLDREAGKAYIQNPAKTINETTENLKKTIQETELSGDKIKAGVVAVAYGGTGKTSVDGIKSLLGLAKVAFVDLVTVALGGTGKTSHTANAVLTGNGTSAVKNVATANGAFYATSANGAAKFGTLPVAQGGTGADSASNARSNLGLGSAAVEDTIPVTKGGTGKTNAVEALSALGGVGFKKLWENASPTSEFAEQDITVDWVNDYDLFVVEYKLQTSLEYRLFTFAVPGYSSLMQGMLNVSGTETVTFLTRRCLPSINGYVRFTDCYYKKASDTTAKITTTSLIPFRIYGIKGVQ